MKDRPQALSHSGYNIGGLMIRIGFWGPVYYNYFNKEPPKLYR